MKTMYALFLCFALFATGAIASPGVEEGQADGQCQPAEEPKFEALMNGETESIVDPEARGYWHCIAYPNGHGHGHGHHAYDVHYSHAYWRAMRECQYYHHYCHAHCHYDHR